VDGSSLFPGLFESSKSDLYVVPVTRRAFLNPWNDDELDIVCRFADHSGQPCRLTPDNVLFAAAEKLRSSTGATLKALAELEFYLILEREDDRFAGLAQRNYHQAAPYLHGRAIADEILRVTSAVTGGVKYCHAEVGYVDRVESEDPEIDGRRVEQYELEFDLMPVEDLGFALTIARWLVRVVADRHGASVTYLPKLEQDMAGSGMHLHFAVERDGRNTMRNADGELSDDALRVIGGLIGEVPALTAFGNTVAASYLRLVPGQEAPTRVCWGRHDRSSLLRVPLSFRTPNRMDLAFNPEEDGPYPDVESLATVEYRSPDGTAFPSLLLAATTLCIAEGLAADDGIEIATRFEVTGGVGADAPPDESLPQLPASAAEAADRLQERREAFVARGLPGRLIDLVIRKLRLEDDRNLGRYLRAMPDTKRQEHGRRWMHKDLHKH
jgi:glutamine synthetase